MKRRVVKYLGYADEARIISLYYVIALLILLVFKDTLIGQWIISNGVIILPLSLIILLGVTIITGFIKKTYISDISHEEKIIMLLSEILRKLYK